MNLNTNLDLSRPYWIKANATGNLLKLFLLFKPYENANNANFGSFQKKTTLTSQELNCLMWNILENLFSCLKLTTIRKKLGHWNERLSNLLAIRTQWKKDTQGTKGFKLITLGKLFQMSLSSLLHEHLRKYIKCPNGSMADLHGQVLVTPSLRPSFLHFHAVFIFPY